MSATEETFKEEIRKQDNKVIRNQWREKEMKIVELNRVRTLEYQYSRRKKNVSKVLCLALNWDGFTLF